MCSIPDAWSQLVEDVLLSYCSFFLIFNDVLVKVMNNLAVFGQMRLLRTHRRPNRFRLRVSDMTLRTFKC